MSDSSVVQQLDQHLRLRLADLDAAAFERFFLGFFNSGISLVIERSGERVQRQVIEANTYAAGSGRAQKGIDLIAKMQGGETWAFQCKRHKSWNVQKTKKAIADATYPAQHYFLLVACDPHKDVQDEIDRHPSWSFWNLDRICDEFRQRVPKNRQPQVLTFLSPDELKRFAPYATDALVPAKDYFEQTQKSPHSYHHNYPLVGRAEELTQLEAFAFDKKAKVLKISAKGGEGKTRILWEFAKRLESAGGNIEIRFLNPHSTGDLTLALWDKNTPQIIVVDDAHRLERVSHELLVRVAQASSTKLILATRPQGNEALEERLREHGFRGITTIDVSPLGKTNMVNLAEEALGPENRVHAKELYRLTGGSPFLTTMAGDLVHRSKLHWGQWHSDSDFRAAVFRSFESDNLLGLAGSDQKLGARLLRVIAMVAPVAPDAVFYERAAVCLGVPRVEVEAMLQRLQAAGIVSVEKNNLRVIPDLFGDFLVFNTAFDPKHRLPEFARTVLEQFAPQAAALLRNLAEASWVAGTETIGRNELLRPLLQAEFHRFEASSFFERGQTLEKWAEFSVFIPKESLELASKSLELTTASRGTPSELQLDEDGDGINSHRYVKGWIPGLLKPIAMWHDQYRAEALDFLWQLGLNTPLEIIGGAKNHPWSVIAQVVEFKPRKPIAVIEAALKWVEELVQRPTVISEIERTGAILTTFLGPCFERFVDYSEWQGRSVHWWSAPVDIERTAPLRDRALDILRQLVDHGSWRVALSTVQVVERALHRVAGVETSRVKNAEKFREAWREERLKALILLERILDKHSEILVKFTVRQSFLRDIAYEEDIEFSKAARVVLTKIVETTELRVITVINSQGYFEFAEEMGAPSTTSARDKMENRWDEYVERIADEVLGIHSQAVDVVTYLERLGDLCISAGFTPKFGELFSAISRHHPVRATSIIRVLIGSDSDFQLSAAWHQLLYDLSDQDEVLPLLSEAAVHTRSEVRGGVIDFFRFRNRKNMTLNDSEREILEQMAANAHTDEIVSFVRLVQWTGESCAEWSFRLLGMLRLGDLGPQANGEILAALNPHGVRDTIPPLATVQHALGSLVRVPKIEVDHYGGGWERIVKLYPRAVYDFVLSRAEFYEQSRPKERYQVLPHDILARFRIDGLATERDFPAICSFLWEKLYASRDTFMEHTWLELFQGIVIEYEQYWWPQLKAAIAATSSLDRLRVELEILHFDGSMIIFGNPAVARMALEKALDLDGTKGYERIRTVLYVISGPQGRSFKNGELDEKSDYVEAAAIEAANEHAKDSILGPFYRWIVEIERHEREQNRRRYQADMAALDDS